MIAMLAYFKLSPNTETTLKTTLLLAAIMTAVGFVGSLVAGTAGMLASFLVTAGLSFGVMWYSREIALWLMDAKEIKPEDEPEGFDLYAMVDALRQYPQINLKVMPKVCTMETEAKNAFATGRHQQHTAIAITTGLLRQAKEYTKGDMVAAKKLISAILLHELGHIVHNDIAIKTTASILMGSIRLLSESLYKQRKQKDVSRSAWGTIAEFMLFYFIVPFFGNLLVLALSRTREYAADDMAADCGKAADLAEAFELLKKPDPKNTKEMRAFSSMMCASLNPESDQKVADSLKSPEIGWFHYSGLMILRALSTHPPLESRIARMKDRATDCENKETTEKVATISA
jgi:heat shock protein HtpX